MESRYSSKHMQDIWSLENKYQVWLRVEFTAYSVMAENGVFSDDINAVSEKLKPLFIKVDTSRIQQIEATTNHDVVAFIQYLEEATGGSTKFFHYGMTSSDLVDTSLAIILSHALNAVKNQLIKNIGLLINLAEKNAGIITTGRTHGMHAQPTTLSNFFAGHAAEFKRCLQNLNSAMDSIMYGKLSGPVGAYLNIDPEVELAVMNRLGLKVETAATQVVPRDRHMDAVYALVRCAVACERFATNIRHLHRSEVGDILEGFPNGQKGSSSMPHKKNPITCEKICGLSRIVRAFLSPAIEDVVLWHERDISHSSVERVILPQATSYTEHILQMTSKLIEGLYINFSSINQRFRHDNAWLSESIMLKLIQKGNSRIDAHNIVQEVMDKRHSISRYLESNNLLTEQEANECVNHNNVIKHEVDILKRVKDI